MSIMVHEHACMHNYVSVSEMLKRNPEHAASVDSTDEDETTKNIMQQRHWWKKNSTEWTRGHLFIVCGGGHIDTWQPLYE